LGEQNEGVKAWCLFEFLGTLTIGYIYATTTLDAVTNKCHVERIAVLFLSICCGPIYGGGVHVMQQK
jgi:hypothetical protein